MLSKFDLLLSGEQRNDTDLFQVDLNGVIDSDTFSRQSELKVIGEVRIESYPEVVIEVHILNDFDIISFTAVIEAVDLIDIEIQFFEGIGDLLGSELAVSLTSFKKGIDSILFMIQNEKPPQ